MIKQEKTLLTADTPWGEIKPLIGYVLSERERERERVHKISETPNFRWIFCTISVLFLFCILQRYEKHTER